jgi:hypothetical protein
MLPSRPCRRLRAASVAFAATLFAATPGLAASCPPFPYVAWWGDTTHERVTSVVQQRYNGDFSPVINMLVQELAKMEEAHGRAQPYAVPSTTRRLGGPQLTIYMHQTRLAISVVRCLETKAAKRPDAIKPTAARVDGGGRS